MYFSVYVRDMKLAALLLRYSSFLFQPSYSYSYSYSNSM